jgi:phage recombination protein Bet
MTIPIRNVYVNNDKKQEEILIALKNSIYPGAKDESVSMVINYCKNAKLDPLQRPVHIVPISVKDSNTGSYYFKDVIMPGIGLYRTQALRSGEYCGMTEPQFGKEITEVLDGVEVTYPEWCLITVKRFVKGIIAEFTSKEYWKENYATASSKTSAPNKMWLKRPRGQLAKCTEAQSLRKGFTELLGSLPTYEEFEGNINCLTNEKKINSEVNGIEKLKEVLNIEDSKVDQLDENSIVEYEKINYNENYKYTDIEVKENLNKYLPVMKNGKHAGKRIDEVPSKYLEWMINDNHSDKNIAKEELDRRKS